ncbi:hypothetical protein [Methylomonas rapida]|uniref:Mu-like prophage FluMu N-terminal domain-containing protein n=1 Tax=Methylomonas rapida TaxID=2963939 RepID=A0ABY7GLU0_9GAMM|nr:hypothetical protein [Methylomonas rapida]WAR43604.1 hypothetical protein NM686_014615 [Methylomonas rapida]WAR45475.1 hypothetical protein NM686_002885 [Methylomonas rapida]
MPKLYARVNLRTDLEKRDRAGLRFTRNWRELDGIDDATLAALQEDPYLEVSDSPTVLVEVAAATQTGAIETAQDPNNTPESLATDEGSTGETAAEGTDTGTASPEANAAEAETENDEAIETGETAPAADAADAVADGTAATEGEQQANVEEKTEADPRMDAIKAAIAQLDANNAEHWLSDGKPGIDAITALTGFKVLAAERDQAWNQIKTQAAAE